MRGTGAGGFHGMTTEDQMQAVLSAAQEAGEIAMKAMQDAAAAQQAAAEARAVVEESKDEANNAAERATEVLSGVQDVSTFVKQAAETIANHASDIDATHASITDDISTITDHALYVNKTREEVGALFEGVVRGSTMATKQSEVAIAAAEEARISRLTTEQALAQIKTIGEHMQEMVAQIAQTLKDVCTIHADITARHAEITAGIQRTNDYVNVATTHAKDVVATGNRLEAMIGKLAGVGQVAEDAAAKAQDAASLAAIKCEIVAALHPQIERHATNVADHLEAAKVFARNAGESASVSAKAANDAETHKVGAKQAAMQTGEVAVEVAQIHAKVVTASAPQ